MTSLTKLRIQDFQSHKDTTLNLGQFTCITGASDVGKSAVTRAIRFLVRNGSSTGIVRLGQKKAVLTAEFADGTVETLTKSAAQSTYTLNDEVYAKAGREAPPDIVNLWKLPEPDSRELCITSQHDAPFLLADPPSVVAKVLGELTNANMLMEAVREANRQRTETNNEIKAREREVEEIKQELLGHAGFKTRVATVATARKFLDELTALQNDVDMVEAILAMMEQANATIETNSGEVVAYDALDSALDEAEKVTDEILAVEGVLGQIAEAKKRVASARYLAETKGAHAAGLEKAIHAKLDELGVCPLCGQVMEDK